MRRNYKTMEHHTMRYSKAVIKITSKNELPLTANFSPPPTEEILRLRSNEKLNKHMLLNIKKD